MTRPPKEIRNNLLEEAKEWDAAISKEKVEDVQKLLTEAELFKAPRPARQPVSVRHDPYDISMTKRIATKKGIPHTQLMDPLASRENRTRKETFCSRLGSGLDFDGNEVPTSRYSTGHCSEKFWPQTHPS